MRLVLLVVLALLLVAGCGQEASQKEASAKAPDRAIWRKLRKDMPADKVRALLGEPLRVEEQENVSCWIYLRGELAKDPENRDNVWVLPRGAVLFSSKGAGSPKVKTWKEP
jgi:hypothetical protein